MTESTPLLEVRDLRVEFPATRRGEPVSALDGVSLSVQSGQTLGLLGESGSGKSTLANAVLGLITPTEGEILVDGHETTRLPARARRALARRVQVVFQDPYGSLNPSRTVGSTLAEPLRLHYRIGRAQAAAQVADTLEQVGLPSDAATRYPGQFSGGQRQRIAIARALILQPDLLVCDEPTSALDLSVQAQILNLLLDLQRQRNLAYLFISHDIDVVRHLADRVAVLLRGHLVEEGPVEQVMAAPRHPYTQALLAAAPTSAGREPSTLVA